MPDRPHLTPLADTGRAGARLWWGYAGLCLLCWGLYTMAGTEWQRGAWRLWEGVYEATLNLGAPMLLGPLAWPWVRALQRRERPPAQMLAWHALGAASLVLGWLVLEMGAAWCLFGAAHAQALLEQRVLWRTVWGVVLYVALVFGFGGVLHARRARQAAVSAAEAEAALVRAELAAVNGKLNPHFLFNTLNTLLMLTRRDAAAAEDTLLRFARMMRHVLDGNRSPQGRVTLREELDFVRDHLALEALRLGPRLQVDWAVDEAVLDDTLPPLTLQPLVENAVTHGVAPQVDGGRVTISARRDGTALQLVVADNGPGCVWPAPAGAAGRGVGLSALQRRFELDYAARAELQVRSAPGQGFEVRLRIPQDDEEA